ncbi:hypothetical protein F0919_02250 [Taibaiella lutea]|uniref:Periplasmic heavy metal sensor n=1 Tax=Taibaiella lutea TaxID=2608001 RepID=A0A5M6CQ51_9BACT|nr:hypothetical protein [Taibaiella lutea]KAA5536510.1 hypothetical protein F0919_02250 [Taibaiella lutea]
MLKRFFSLILLITAFSFSIHGQEKATPNPEIRKLRIAFITDKMSLTQNQMQQFLPIFTSYSDELLFQKRAIKALENNPNSQYVVEQRQKLEQKMVEIKGRYKDRFLRIISAQQLAAMYKAESEFKQFLIEYLKKNGK